LLEWDVERLGGQLDEAADEVGSGGPAL